ncbi:MAG: selenide, water dikinase SelD, partial [Nitrospirae bacterium]
GGHTLEDKELKAGLSVTGILKERVLLSRGAEPGDLLILTKPLGTGILTTALKGGRFSMDDLKEAIGYMTALNKDASEAALKAGATACTDVTGFGLLGHAYNMVKGSQLELVIESPQVPFMKGVKEFASTGIIPQGAYRNYEFIKDRVRFSRLVKEEVRLILCDPQTSGGLLVSLKKEGTEIFNEMKVPFYVIGHFREGEGTITVV